MVQQANSVLTNTATTEMYESVYSSSLSDIPSVNNIVWSSADELTSKIAGTKLDHEVVRTHPELFILFLMV